MKGEALVSLGSAMLGIALVTVLVSHTETKNVIGALTSGWVNSVRAVMGTDTSAPRVR